MMGPKAEAVSTKLFLILFSTSPWVISFLEEHKEAHPEPAPHYANTIHYQQWGHMEMMLTQISPLL